MTKPNGCPDFTDEADWECFYARMVQADIQATADRASAARRYPFPCEKLFPDNRSFKA